MHGYPGTPVGQLFGNQRRPGVALGQVAQGQPLASSQNRPGFGLVCWKGLLPRNVPEELQGPSQPDLPLAPIPPPAWLGPDFDPIS